MSFLNLTENSCCKSRGILVPNRYYTGHCEEQSDEAIQKFRLLHFVRNDIAYRVNRVASLQEIARQLI